MEFVFRNRGAQADACFNIILGGNCTLGMRVSRYNCDSAAAYAEARYIHAGSIRAALVNDLRLEWDVLFLTAFLHCLYDSLVADYGRIGIFDRSAVADRVASL